MGFLDGGLFGSSGGGGGSPSVRTQTVNAEPWAAQQPYVKEMFAGAQDAYRSASPQYFSGSTVVGFSPQMQQALTGMESRANAGSPLQQAGNAQALSTVQGDFLNNNPFLTGAYNNAAQVVTDQWNNQIAPGIDSQFERAGRMGSGLYAQNRNTAETTLSNTLGNMADRMSYGNYSAERTNQLNMARNSGAMAQQDYGDLNKMMAVGTARDRQGQAQLQDQINRFNFEQNRPWDQLARYSGLVQGGYGSSQTTTSPLYSNPGANFLSGALGGAQLGSMTGLGGTAGAIGGGLLGLMG